MNASQIFLKSAVQVHLSSDRNNDGKISHGLAHRLFGPICSWCADKHVPLAGPLRQSDLECRQQCAEKRCSSLPRQFFCGIRCLQRKMENQSLGGSGGSQRSFKLAPEPRRSGQVRFPKWSAPPDFFGLPKIALSSSPCLISLRQFPAPVEREYNSSDVSR